EELTELREMTEMKNGCLWIYRAKWFFKEQSCYLQCPINLLWSWCLDPGHPLAIQDTVE
ncbi:hypothetical protein STEG23_016638, partial [Scotinomys teguina]